MHAQRRRHLVEQVQVDLSTPVAEGSSPVFQANMWKEEQLELVNPMAKTMQTDGQSTKQLSSDI